MNVKQAKAEGLEFTGAWERYYNKADMVKEAAEIRKTYKCRAVVVSDNGGWGIYADQKYRDLKELEHSEQVLELLPKRLEAIHLEYKKDIEAISAYQTKLESRIKEIKDRWAAPEV